VREVDVNDLPKWSPWPERILHGWLPKERTPESIKAEYDGIKYAASARFFAMEGSPTDPRVVRKHELGNDPSSETCVSDGKRLYVTTRMLAQARMSAMIFNEMRYAAKDCATVVELGCGYGYNICALHDLIPDVQFLGGELSENAVVMASDMFRGNPRVCVRAFDFLDPKTYALLDEAKGPLTVFTCHAVEQLRSARPLLDELLARRNKVRCVVHFEPLPPVSVTTMLGLLRQRYLELNGYNRDLLECLRSREADVDVVTMRRDVFGVNPLNPTSIVQWEPKCR